jgi:hypothetical protein
VSYISPCTGRDLVACAQKRPVIRSQRLSKVVNGIDVHESRGDISIREVSD